MAIGSTPGGSGHVVPDDPDHPLVTPEDTVAIARMEEARFREVGVKVGELLARVNDIAVASGVAPGSPDDGKVAAFVRDVDSLTRGALDDLLQSALGPVLDSGPVHVSRFGAVGDGATDDTAALVAAGASGREVHFDGDKRYNFVGPVTITSGTRWVTYGAQLYCATPRDAPSLILEGEVSVDRLDVSFAGGDADRGLLIRGSRVDVDWMRLVARAQDTNGNYRQRAMNIGVEGTGCTDVRIGTLISEGFTYGPAIWDSKDITIGRLQISGHLQGLLIRNSARVAVEGGSAKNPAQSLLTGGPGENGILIENSRTDTGAGSITIRDFTVDGAGEHGFRISGQAIDGVTFDNCKAVRTGSGTTVASGGCGFKVLGATDDPSPNNRHRNIRYLNCTVEDVANKIPSPNCSGFNIGKCNGVVLENCSVVSTVAGQPSAAYGVVLIGSGNVTITNPRFENPTGDGIRLYWTETTPTAQWGNEPTNITISGGVMIGCRAGLGVNVGGQTVRRLAMSGTVIDGATNAVTSANATIRWSLLDISASNIAGDTLSGCDGFMVRGAGVLKGTSACRVGSTWVDYAGGFKRYTGAAWALLE